MRGGGRGRGRGRKGEEGEGRERKGRGKGGGEGRGSHVMCSMRRPPFTSPDLPCNEQKMKTKEIRRERGGGARAAEEGKWPTSAAISSLK